MPGTSWFGIRKMQDKGCYTFVVHGRYPSVNEWIDSNRVSKSGKRGGYYNQGQRMKRSNQAKIVKELRDLPPLKCKIRPPVTIRYHFYEPNRRRDLSNISGFFHKVFEDALVEMGLLVDDSNQYVVGQTDIFDIDRKNPRIEITIQEL